MSFGWTSISKGLQATIGILASVLGTLGDPSVVGFLPHKVAVGVAIGGAVLAGLSHPPSTPISGDKISPKVADKLGVVPPGSDQPQ